MNQTKLSPKVALLNFDATLGSAYIDVINAITQYASSVQAFRSQSVTILGNDYLVSKAINTSLIDYQGTKLSDYLAKFVPTFSTKPNVWFIYSQTFGNVVYVSDTLSRVDNSLFDLAHGRPDVQFTDDNKFTPEYMELISNENHVSYKAKYNSQALSWQQPNVQTAIQVEPNINVSIPQMPTPTEVQPSNDIDLAKIAKLLKEAGLL